MNWKKLKTGMAAATSTALVASLLLTAIPVVPGTKVLAANEKAVQSNATEDTYLNNQGKLTETPLIQLPLGAVQAESWLENQLLLMKNGITGNMKTYEDYNMESSEWLNGNSGEAWENGPYFARGLTALAYTLDDEELIEEALTWVAAVIDSQQENGYFGPKSDNAWWSRMPMLCVVRDFYEAVEAKPEAERTEKEKEYFGKVIPFLEKYFRYQASELPNRPLSNWADARGGDNLEVVYWLYNHVYDEENPEASQWLLDLGDLIYSQTTNWENEYNNTTVRQHVVNTSQGMKTPAVYSQYKNEEKYKVALSNGIDNMGIDHGRIDGLPNSDEAARDNRSTRGSETCGTVEGLLSTEIAMKVLGEAWMGDRIETLAYNALPAAYPADYSGHAYYILQNQVMDTLGNHEFDCDHGDSSAFGAPLGFDCCFANNHMGWAKFVQNMWMATADGGLAIVAYGPNNVTAEVADGKTAVFEQKTDYPFKDSIQLNYSGDTAEFELKVRIPEWAKSASVKVNGQEQMGAVTGEYYTIEREWTKGDKVSLQFKSEVELTSWYNNSTAVKKGPLIYSLKIEEDWRTYDENDARELKVEHKENQPLREVYPASAWNYGLVTDGNASFEVKEAEQVAMQPFESDNAPVTITAKGVKLEQWILDGNIAGPQPYGPIDYEESEIEDITLIPYACERLRITHFPTMDNEQDTDKVVRTQSTTVKRNGNTYQEFDNIVVPKADNYHLKVEAEGSGTMTINSKYTQEVSGNFELGNLKNLEGLNGYFQFKDGQYNNIRFSGDIKVSKVEVSVEGREIEDIQIFNSSRSGDSAKIMTNLDPQETPYRVVYGTESGKYTNTVDGFSDSTATLNDLQKEQVYYAQVVSTVCGKEVRSPEVVLEVNEDEGGLKPNPGVPNASYDGFNTLNYMQQEWKEYDPDDKVTIQASPSGSEKLSEIRFEKGSNVKAALELEGSENWVDYVVEANISVDKADTNNAGIMFRATDIGEGSDNFKGYFVGIGKAGEKNGILVGYADGSWHTIEEIHDSGIQIKPGENYTIKVVVYDNMFAVYLNNQLLKVYQDDRFYHGTVGLRSYNEAFTAHNVTVRNIKEEDLTVFEDFISGGEEPENPDDPQLHPEHEGASYEGFKATSDGTKADFDLYDPEGKITFEQDGTMSLGSGERVKAVLKTDEPEKWIDYAAEATLSVDEGKTNNCGMMFRANEVGEGPDAYKGYFAGIGWLVGQAGQPGEPGLMIGYADGKAWHDIAKVPCDIQPGQEYRLKVVAYDSQFAIYLDDKLMYQFTDDQFASGKVGLRSYNEAFKVKNMTVRSLTEEDIKVFGRQEEVVPDFKDTFDTDTWDKFGDIDKIKVEDGQMTLGQSTNIKAAAGDTAWKNMVYSADVTLREGEGNAGLLVRSSQEGSGGDNYFGYYFGINGNVYEIGKANGSWKQLETGELKLDVSKPHRLQVVAYEDVFMFYVDENLITTILDSEHTQGRIGARGHDRAMAIDNVEVRGLTEEEIAKAQEYKEQGKQIEITASSANNAIQVKYPKVSNATSFRVVYGKESGVYTGEFTDIFFNSYKGGGIFTHDKVAFSVPEPGTYYVKLYGMNGNTTVATSNELTITTDERAAVDTDKAKAQAMLTQAENTDVSGFTSISKKRMEDAKTYATSVLGTEASNQIQYALAEDLLAISINTPDTEYAGEDETTEPEKPDKSKLQALYDQYKDADSKDYKDGFEELEDALAKAKVVLDDENAVQTEVDAALQYLQNAIDGLVPIDGENPGQGGQGDNGQSGGSNQENPSSHGQKEAVQTGDSNHVMLVFVICAVASVFLIAAWKIRRNKKEVR